MNTMSQRHRITLAGRDLWMSYVSTYMSKPV